MLDHSVPLAPLRYRTATSADVPEMERCRLGDAEAGPADARMAAYLDGVHHPQQALALRTAFVALQGDHVVGYIAGHATARYGCDGEVQHLYVTPRCRRRAVAATLLRMLAEWFVREGIHRVCVDVDVNSAGAVPFYVARGAVPLNKYWYVWDDIAQLTIRRLD
jgi:GNAT superfamily N-acetyltransferase